MRRARAHHVAAVVYAGDEYALCPGGALGAVRAHAQGEAHALCLSGFQLKLGLRAHIWVGKPAQSAAPVGAQAQRMPGRHAQPQRRTARSFQPVYFKHPGLLAGFHAQLPEDHMVYIIINGRKQRLEAQRKAHAHVLRRAQRDRAQLSAVAVCRRRGAFVFHRARLTRDAAGFLLQLP